MSDTPRTDAAKFHPPLMDASTLSHVYCVDPEFARELERELAAAAAERARLVDMIRSAELEGGIDQSDPSCDLWRIVESFFSRAREKWERDLAAAAERDAAIREIVVQARAAGHGPISKCQCEDSTGWTAIRCCNLCGQIHKSETLDWRPEQPDGLPRLCDGARRQAVLRGVPRTEATEIMTLVPPLNVGSGVHLGVGGVRVLVGDSRQLLSTLPDESANCCVTSPPYWGLRDYGHSDQIGQEATPEKYVESLVAVFEEVRRVLRADGTLWLNLGDSYSSGGRTTQVAPTLRTKAKDSASGKHANLNGLCCRPGSPENCKPKDLIGIPWIVAFALRSAGWWLRSEIIWHKPNPMPESVQDRPTSAHEKLFLFAKSSDYYYDADAIAEPASVAMYEQVEQGYEGNGLKDYAGNGVQNPSSVKARIIANAKNKQALIAGKSPKGFLSRGESRCGIGLTRNKRNVWTVNAASYREAHFATYPPALITPCILAGCPAGGTVLDPFGGSGTTGMVARELGRKSILIELNPEYAKLIDQRTNTTPGFGF